MARRHPLAMLAVLAVHRSVPVTRDKLAGLLWPDRDSSRARRRLRVTLHALRKAISPSAVASVGDALHLDEGALTCDLYEFNGALDDGDPKRAVAAYAGPFLDGFHLDGQGEFERWSGRVRRRLRRRYRRALDQLADRAEARSGPKAALKWLRLRSASDPYGNRATQRLLDALDRAGERAAALRLLREHERRLRTELGMTPAPWVAAAKAHLRGEA